MEEDPSDRGWQKFSHQMPKVNQEIEVIKQVTLKDLIIRIGNNN